MLDVLERRITLAGDRSCGKAPLFHSYCWRSQLCRRRNSSVSIWPRLHFGVVEKLKMEDFSCHGYENLAQVSLSKACHSSEVNGVVIEKTLPRFKNGFSLHISSIQSVRFVIAGLPLTFHWADNFLFDLD